MGIGQERVKDLLKLGLPTLVLIGVGFFAAAHFVGPAPPRQVAISAGEPDGAYYAYAERYRTVLARHGVELEVRTSAGSVENLQRLSAGEVPIALAQGGVAAPPGSEGELQSLGSLFYEPLWIFLRPNLKIDQVRDLSGLRLSIGSEGSGTRAVAARVLAMNGLPEQAPWLLSLSSEDAAAALVEGRIDGLFIVAGARSGTVQELLEAKEAVPMSFDRAEAYTRRDRQLSHVTLPRGVIDLARDIPARDVDLLAATANLVVRTDLHPVLADLLLQTAMEVHEPGGLFEGPQQFPMPKYLAFPLSPEARRLYVHGPPFLQRFLPFWAATQLDRLKIMLLPLVALLLPLARSFPPLYRWRVRSRIYRWYKELHAVDPEAESGQDFETPEARRAELDRIVDEVSKVPTPPSYAAELYDLRRHIEFVRSRMR